MTLVEAISFLDQFCHVIFVLYPDFKFQVQMPAPTFRANILYYFIYYIIIILIQIVYDISWESYSLSDLHKRSVIQKALEK